MYDFTKKIEEFTKINFLKLLHVLYLQVQNINDRTNPIFTMKIFILLVAAFIWMNRICTQSIINVNNQATGVQTQYTNLQAAVTAAQDNDIIYLYPSSISYGNATINKKLTIIGPGYNVAQNPSLGINTFVSNAILGDITYTAGSNDGTITGCDINYIVLNGPTNIQITRNKIRNRIYLTNTNNVLINGCYFEFVSNGSRNGSLVDNNYFNISANTNNNSLIIRNNIFLAVEPYSGGCASNTCFMDNIFIGATSNSIVENNIFRDRIWFNNSIVRNNILISNDIQIQGGGNTITNNILVPNQTGLHSSNIINVPEANIFEGWPTQGSRSFDDRFMLKAGSPALGAGVGGVNCGAFGGDGPYKLSGLPSIPLVYQINAPASGSASSGLNVNVKIRANN